jgi:hypothetical protein
MKYCLFIPSAKLILGEINPRDYSDLILTLKGAPNVDLEERFDLNHSQKN